MSDYVLTEGGQSKVSVQGIREAVTAATTIVGTTKPLAYDKEVIYAKIGTAVAVGQLCQAPAAVANHGRCAVAVTASIGAKSVKLVLGATSASQDLYKNGLLIVECGTGSGYSYMVAGHKAFAASHSAAEILLKDGLEVALTTASLCTLLKNKCDGVAPTTDSAAQTGPIVGVALCSASANYYVYLGKKGEWPADVEGTWVVGGQLAAGSATGTVMPAAAITDELVGVARSSASGTGYGICDFDL